MNLPAHLAVSIATAPKGFSISNTGSVSILIKQSCFWNTENWGFPVWGLIKIRSVNANSPAAHCVLTGWDVTFRPCTTQLATSAGFLGCSNLCKAALVSRRTSLQQLLSSSWSGLCLLISCYIFHLPHLLNNLLMASRWSIVDSLNNHIFLSFQKMPHDLIHVWQLEHGITVSFPVQPKHIHKMRYVTYIVIWIGK